MNGVDHPVISVVMGVYNEEASLEKTVRSILSQSFKEFEFIIVNDGSIDRTAEILDNCAKKDARIRVEHRDNHGLTRSLIYGCALARGEFIARQDAGDESLPGRLALQLQCLRENPEAVMTGCGVDSVTPAGELLYSSVRAGMQLDEGVRELSVDRIKGPPHHGGTMFRRKAYSECGGYRPQFRVAQDMDLWIRLSEVGKCVGLLDILYRATVRPGSISIMRGADQLYFGGLAIESAKLRRNGRDDSGLFENMSPPSRKSKLSRQSKAADYYYFVGSALLDSNQVAARTYLTKALKANPFHLKARLRRLKLIRD
jgi:glycosyltransferase involved in cell wall biosynthesis